MKKKLVASLAAAMVLSVAGTSFAASNPFVDVPAKHWAYASVMTLAQAGIVDGYGDGTFRGDKTMTRYEMAQIVAKAMARSDKADAAQKAAIDKLAVEFASELQGLNVRLTNVENKVDNVKWGGEVRVRYDSEKIAGKDRDNGSMSKAYTDLWATAQINPNWIAKVEYESTKFLNDKKVADAKRAGADGDEDNTSRIFAQGTLFGTKATVGKFNPFSAYGLIIDDNMTGAQFEFGNEVQARVGYGKYAGGINGAGLTHSPTYAFGELDYAISKDTNVKAAFHHVSDLDKLPELNNQKSINYSEIGFDTKIATDWGFMATYGKSNLDRANYENKAYFTQVKYKAADTKVVGSYDIFANYRNTPKAAQLAATWDYGTNMKGLAVGFDYVPDTNIKINAFYLDGKQLSTKGSEKNDKVSRVQVEFFF